MSSDLASTSVRTTVQIDRRIPAFFASLVLHLGLLGCGVIATTLVRVDVLRPAVPREPLLVLAVALILSHCSLAAIWCFRMKCSPHTKTFAIAFASGCLWLMLVRMLKTTRGSGEATLAWAVCIALQVVLTGIATLALELSLNYREAAARSRFSLRYLLVWTTLLAVALGGAGAILNRFGSKLADVPNWEYFLQLQAVAVAGAALAIAIYTSVRLPQTWPIRSLSCAATTFAGAILAPACLWAIFGNKIGVPPADLVWLFAGQGLFLLATLVPLEAAANLNPEP